MKQNLFEANKISLDEINICSNQIIFCLKSNKLQKILQKLILFKQIFIWYKDILFESDKFYFI